MRNISSTLAACFDSSRSTAITLNSGSVTSSGNGSGQDAEHFVGTDRFLVQRRLGAGAFGVVYEAYDRQERSVVALKVLRVGEADALYRFKKGFRSLADIRHPNLVSFYELLSEEGLWFFSMELIPGIDFIETLLSDASYGPGAAPERIRPLLLQLVRGLHTVHQNGKVHRDIKPPNVLVTPEGRVKLLDFGLVTELEESRLPQVGKPQMIGTPAYMAPEQVNGDPGSPASDWYGVGVMLFQALTGELPFKGSLMEILTEKQDGLTADDLDARVPGLPVDLQRLCLGLLEPDSDKRLTGEDVLQCLGAEVPTSGPPKAEDTIFVGREQQLEQLADALEASRHGAVMAYVQGLSGMGKTMLIEHFLRQEELKDPQPVILRGRCYLQESVPYKALDSLIDALSRYLMSLPSHKVEVLLPTQVSALARLFPVLLRVPAISRAPLLAEEDDSDPQILRRYGFGALRDLLSRLAVRHTLILVIDDMQWGDIDSFLLLDELLKAADPPPFLLIGSFRSEDLTSSPFLRSLNEQRESLTWRGIEVRDIMVGELSAEESERLVRHHASADASVGDQHLQRLLAGAAGSPLFLSELARYYPQASHLKLSRHPHDSLQPARAAEFHVRDLIHARLEKLSASARRLLEIVAVAGKPMDLAIARQASELDTEAMEALAELRKDRLVRLAATQDGREEIESYHDRIREAVVESLGNEGLRLSHRRLALALESSGRADPETLVVHFQATEEDGRAARYAISAARRADEALAFERAARLYRLALDLLPDDSEQRYHLRVQLGEALGNAGRSRDAAETFLLAVGDSGTINPVEVQRYAAEKLLVSGHIDRGLAILRHVLRTEDMELQERSWKSLLRLWLLRMKLRFRGHEFTAQPAARIEPATLRRIDICWSVEIGLCLVDVLHASEFHARHLLLALDAGDPQRIARGLAMEVFFGSMEGGDGIDSLHKARELAGRVEGHYASSLTEMASGMLDCSRGRWNEADRRLENAENHLRESRRGVTWELDTARQFRALALVQLGRWQELFAALPDLLEQAREQENLYLEIHLHHWVESLRDLADDQTEKAADALAEGLRGWSQEGFHYQHFGHLIAAARLALYSGKGLEAWALVDSQWSELQRSMIQRIDMVLVLSHDLRARCAIAAAAEANAHGETGQVRRLLRYAASDAARLERAGSTWSLALASTCRASIARLRGQSGLALEQLTVAEAAFEAAEMPVHAAVVRRRLGQLPEARRTGEVESADQELRRRGIRNPQRMASVFAPGW